LRIVAVLLVLLLGTPSLRAEDAEDRKKAPAPTYESPILSLLFLPMNLLIKMTSVLAPEEPAKPSRSASDSSAK